MSIVFLFSKILLITLENSENIKKKYARSLIKHELEEKLGKFQKHQTF